MLEHFKGEEVFVKKILEFKDQALNRQRIVLTKFLNPYHQSIVYSIIGKSDDLIVLEDGGLINSETKRLIIAPAFYQIEKADLMNIVKQLTISDFTKCILNSNPNHKDERLIEFITNKSFLLLNGNMLEGVKVYIKIDLDESDDDMLVAVSFHSTKSYGKHPFSDL